MELISILFQQTFLTVLLLLTAPFSALGFLTLIVMFFYKVQVVLKWRKWFLFFILFFGCTTLFNVVDFIRYRQCGLSISPINQEIYHLFFPPPNLYEPYATIPILPASYEYSIQYQHKYGGLQNVVFVLINNQPKKFEYDNPDKINLTFSGNVTSDHIGKSFTFSKAFTRYFLQPGTNQLLICKYKLTATKELNSMYNLKIMIKGELDTFLQQYPGSYLCIKNGTTK